MSKSIALPYPFLWSKTHPHVAWADLQNNGILIEIAVIALDQNNGDLYFIPIANLDNVDRERLIKVIAKRDSHKYPLWDLLSSSTLKNGMNALEYFNQLVKVRSVSGQIFAPMAGKVGVSGGSLSMKPSLQTTASPAQAAAVQPLNEDVSTGEPAKRGGPGRPPKKQA